MDNTSSAQSKLNGNTGSAQDAFIGGNITGYVPPTHICPNCGYCPCCGRPRGYGYTSYPIYYNGPYC